MKKNVRNSILFMALILMFPLFVFFGKTRVWGASAEMAANQEYVFTSINGEAVSTKSEPGKTTVLIFGKTNCGNTRATVRSIANSDWVNHGDIRVIFGECNKASLADTKSFANAYGCDAITFCYDDENYYSSINNAMWGYFDLFFDPIAGGTLPFTVLIDQNNQVRNVLTGVQTADGIMALIRSFSTSPEDTESENTETEVAETDISDVSGLKAKSEENSIKLSWKKAAGSEGYYIYQYTGKKWKKIATVKSEKTSYTVKNLKSATGFRFGVKAYKTIGGKQVLSKSYTSLYTATNPSGVKFKVTAGKKKATVKWNKVKGADSYQVVYKAGKGSWKKLKTTKSLKYTVKKLRSGQTYTFAVKACKTYKGKTYFGTYKGKKVKIL